MYSRDELVWGLSTLRRSERDRFGFQPPAMMGPPDPVPTTEIFDLCVLVEGDRFVKFVPVHHNSRVDVVRQQILSDGLQSLADVPSDSVILYMVSATSKGSDIAYFNNLIGRY